MKLCRQIVFGFVLFCLTAMACPVQAITPLKVAVVPVINTAQYRYQEDVQIVQELIKKPFKYPYYTVLSADTVTQAMQKTNVSHRPLSVADEKALASLAAQLPADIIVAVELSKVRLNRIYLPWLDDTYIDYDVVLKGYAYSALTGKYNVIKVAKAKREPESLETNAAFIFTELTEQILEKLPYKRIPLAAAP